jgi:hypothetical protein
LSTIFPPCAETKSSERILGGRSAGRWQAHTAKTRLRPLRTPAGIGEQSFALQQVIGRSLPAGQGIVTFFTIFLPFVYCSAPELSTAVVVFPAPFNRPPFSTTQGELVKIKLFLGARTDLVAVSSVLVIDDRSMYAETGVGQMRAHGSRRGSAYNIAVQFAAPHHYLAA